MSEQYRVGQKVLVTEHTGEAGEALTIGKAYDVINVDPDDQGEPIQVLDDDNYAWWLTQGTFELVTTEQGSVNATNPFESINSKSLSHLLDLAGQLVAAYDDCDESTRQMIPLTLKIGGIEVKRES